jgi:hypothetical protein
MPSKFKRCRDPIDSESVLAIVAEFSTAPCRQIAAVWSPSAACEQSIGEFKYFVNAYGYLCGVVFP